MIKYLHQERVSRITLNNGTFEFTYELHNNRLDTFTCYVSACSAMCINKGVKL